MEIKQLKELLINDITKIKEILIAIGCDRIVEHSNEYRCAKNINDTNPTRVVVKFNENITSRIYDLVPIKGDIFTLIMELKKCSLSNAINLCCSILGIKNKSDNWKTKEKVRKKAFGGFYSSIKKNNKFEMNISNYDDSILNNYINKGNARFKDDGIEYDIQTEFNIMFDIMTNRIVVPWRNLNGLIVGIMGRFNESAEYCTQYNISKWLPLPNLNFPKSQLIYGLYQNYKYILQSGVIYIGESEKFVLQSASFGVRNTGAIGSHDISPKQREILLSLGVDIVTCMDNDIPDEFNAEQCKRLKSHSHLVGGKVGFAMVDGILKNKESPTDNGIEIWNKCIAKENIFWI